MRMINAVNKYLYGELGYKGAEVYLDPDNSCINMVLKRREGITYLLDESKSFTIFVSNVWVGL